MNRDCRIYRRSTLLQAGIDQDTLDSLELVDPVGPPDARFQLLTDGLQLPSCSFVSRTDDDVWFLDTGVEYDGGRMYVGERDFSGMASVAGYVSKASVSRVYEENEKLRNDLVIAKSLINDLRGAVAGLVGATTMERSETRSSGKRATSIDAEPRGNSPDTSDLDVDAL